MQVIDPPLSGAEQVIREHSRRQIEILAGLIGERSLVRPSAQQAAVHHLRRELSSLGYDVREQTYPARGRTHVNLEAVAPGRDPAAPCVVYGAHYDTAIHSPGANDNGTGLAAVLEAVRHFAAEPTAHTASVRFVLFANEEPPYFHTKDMGSRVYAAECRRRGDRIAAMLTPETIGYYSDEPGSQTYPDGVQQIARIALPDRGDFVAMIGNLESAELVLRCGRIFSGAVRFPVVALPVPESVTGAGFSDHWSFWQEGYPALMVTDTAMFRYPHYHKPTDTPDQIDFDRLARVVMGLNRVLMALAK